MTMIKGSLINVLLLAACLQLIMPGPCNAQETAGPSSASEQEEPLIREGDAENEKNTTIIRAYKKEYAFLLNEKKALLDRLQQLEAQKAVEIAHKEREIKTLQDSLLLLSDRVEQATTDHNAEEDRAEKLEEMTESLDQTIAQASQSLEKHDIALPEFEGGFKEIKNQQLTFIFSRALSLLAKFGTIHSEEKGFFLSDGSKVEGQFFWIGNIAVVGKSARASGPLAPAGNGHFRLWSDDPFNMVSSFEAGQKPSHLAFYLYESATKAVEQMTKKTVADVVASGGVIAYIIVILGILAAVMLVSRVYFLLQSTSNTSQLLEQVSGLVAGNRFEEALELCHPSRGAASRVLAATIRHLHTDPDHLEDIISESILHETPFLEKFESAITVFAAVAPLLGLLGTVTGMISTFDVITEYGSGDPKLLSGGISEALVTTELGLMVAIPTLLLGSLLSSWSDRIKTAMERAALRITNIAKEHNVSPTPIEEKVHK